MEWQKEPARAQQFTDAMRFLAAKDTAEHVLFEYPFDSKDSVKLVDVGGGHGDVGILLANKHPKLKVVVQDLPHVVESAKENTPENLKDRLEYQAHDFWTEQPLKDADIYFFRNIFHDWSDPYSIKLLKQTIPALKVGSRVIINDACIPPKGFLNSEQEMALR